MLRRAALFVGNDTGLMHIAAAVGAPTLGPVRAEPGRRNTRPGGTRAAVAATAIRPCELFRRGFDHLTTDTLMDQLSVEAAEAAARRLWQRVAGEAA